MSCKTMKGKTRTTHSLYKQSLITRHLKRLSIACDQSSSGSSGDSRVDQHQQRLPKTSDHLERKKLKSGSDSTSSATRDPSRRRYRCLFCGSRGLRGTDLEAHHRSHEDDMYVDVVVDETGLPVAHE
ncbi:unnamed protein product [Oppiella nova]|uniref:C2H2-type domain-containing protein n=1 Tax=Oppiella nova TaxID=334625 RepID=A0A7R9LG38_9ACAR|nr:unnamed protein product [Oppiella nova]CAG2163315.1 unnamed protein product [Oppiella nova]